MDKTTKLLEEKIDDDFMYYYLAEPNSCTLADVERVEQTLGFKFPEEYVAHLTGELPGFYLVANDDVWRKDIKGGAFWYFLYSLHTFTAAIPSEDVEEDMTLIYRANELKKNTGLDLIPILKYELDPDMYCINKEGKIVYLSSDSLEVTSIDKNFWELLEEKLDEIKEFKDKMKLKNMVK